MICNPSSLQIQGIASNNSAEPKDHSVHIQDIPERPTSIPFWVWADITTYYFATTKLEKQKETDIKRMTTTSITQKYKEDVLTNKF